MATSTKPIAPLSFMVKYPPISDVINDPTTIHSLFNDCDMQIFNACLEIIKQCGPNLEEAAVAIPDSGIAPLTKAATRPMALFALMLDTHIQLHPDILANERPLQDLAKTEGALGRLLKALATNMDQLWPLVTDFAALLELAKFVEKSARTRTDDPRTNDPTLVKE